MLILWQIPPQDINSFLKWFLIWKNLLLFLMVIMFCFMFWGGISPRVAYSNHKCSLQLQNESILQRVVWYGWYYIFPLTTSSTGTSQIRYEIERFPKHLASQNIRMELVFYNATSRVRIIVNTESGQGKVPGKFYNFLQHQLLANWKRA